MSDGRIGNDTLNPENDTLNIEDKILLTLKGNPHITLSQIAEHLGVSRITIQRILSLLQQQGRVLRIGARKNGYWQISEKKVD
ncbi:MAG: HTH domain-containing protein [Bacteroidales bacterium]|nr:HTH domain-containing protein [Bacteroidales bacterium]